MLNIISYEKEDRLECMLIFSCWFIYILL